MQPDLALDQASRANFPYSQHHLERHEQHQIVRNPRRRHRATTTTPLGAARVNLRGDVGPIITDNLPNQRVAQNVDSAQRSRYFLVRYACLHQRIADGDFLCLFTHDPNNPSDFLTKTGINIEKVNDSIAYAIGACNASRSGGDHTDKQQPSLRLRGGSADETADCIEMQRSALRSDRGGCSIPPQRGR